jgi:hypothetical protein
VNTMERKLEPQKPSATLSVDGRKAQVQTQSDGPNALPSLVSAADAMFDLAATERESHVAPSKVSGWSSETLQQAGDRLLGIVAVCAIPGCDIHFITPADEVLRHVGAEEGVASPFARSRAYLRACDADVIAVVVFESKNLVLSLDGTLRPMR